MPRVDDILWKGDAAIEQALAALPIEARDKGLRKGVRDAAKILLFVMQSRAPQKTGILRESLGIKLGGKGMGVYAAVGPRRSFKRRFDRVLRKRITLTNAWRRKRSEDFGLEVAIPTRYAHLVEHGHGGPHAAGAHPFMQSAVDATRNPVRTAIVTALQRALKRLTKAGMISSS
jgi:HK97 gp10 family phage protein